MWRSILFNVVFYGGTVLGLTLLCPLLLCWPKFRLLIPRWWSLWVSWLFTHIIGVTYSISGLDRLPPGPLLFAVKHQSAWETLVLNHILNRPVFLLKKELLWVFPFGVYLKAAGMIGVDRRGSLKSIKNMIREAKQRVSEGRPLVIFPEGSRSEPGHSNPYKKGIYTLHKHLGIPVVPVALNSGLTWPRRTFKKKSGSVAICFLPPLEAGLPEEEFMRQLETTIENKSKSLLPDQVILSPGQHLTDLGTLDPSLEIDLKYLGEDNFVGRPICGYYANRAYATPKLGEILKSAQKEFVERGFSLVIWDAYRPCRAVRDFEKWSSDPRAKAPRQKTHFPGLGKEDLFKEGYIAHRSGHSRGIAVDLTLRNRRTGALLDMGTCFDYMGPASHSTAYEQGLITEKQQENRLLLRDVLVKHGLEPYPQEWWHFNLPADAEPHPHLYFDFEIINLSST